MPLKIEMLPGIAYVMEINYLNILIFLNKNYEVLILNIQNTGI